MLEKLKQQEEVRKPIYDDGDAERDEEKYSEGGVEVELEGAVERPQTSTEEEDKRKPPVPSQNRRLYQRCLVDWTVKSWSNV